MNRRRKIYQFYNLAAECPNNNICGCEFPMMAKNGLRLIFPNYVGQNSFRIYTPASERGDLRQCHQFISCWKLQNGLVLKAKKQNINGKSEVGGESLLVWHPEVHEHLDEQLYYLLLSVKPFNGPRFEDGLRQLMQLYGISRFCFYQVYGNFDVLLRIWLPPRLFREFLQQANNLLPNVQTLVHFLAEKKIRCSAFDLSPSELAQIAEKIDRLDSQKRLTQAVHDAQSEQLAAIEEMQKLGLLKIKSQSEKEDERKKIKAFIALSEPFASVVSARRDQIIVELETMLETTKEFSFTGITLLRGTGFCWVLAKVICRDFAKLGNFVHQVSEKFGGEGVASSTFLVINQEKVIEGDGISRAALQSHETGDRRVAVLLPELYGPEIKQPETLEVKAIEDFITRSILDPPKNVALDREDTAALKNFFIAVIENDREEAFVALYPRIVKTEGALRKPIEVLAKNCSGGIPELLAFLKKFDNLDKSLNRLTMLDSLRAARWILDQKMPEDSWVKSNLSKEKDEEFKAVSECRNIVMHAKEFDARTAWKSLAEPAWKMFLLRSGIESRYQKLLVETSQQEGLA